mmetsp:Transcript_493/g.661  ORF Transcript_493/g.661 Transcript_493/m.661 type:complete len:288 (+) Transcript_493:111-974(+)
MTHNQKRTAWWKEGLYTSICGVLYGGTNTIVGHPFDTVKTKMQAQVEHISMKNNAIKSPYIHTIKNVYQNEGVTGFYKGWIPPFWGSIVYRSLQFAVFEAVYTKLESSAEMLNPVPMTVDMEWRVVAAGFTAASCRAVIECPFEYAKVKGQTGQKWQISQVYKGFTTLYPRSTGLMTLYFCLVDRFRKHTNLFDTKMGQFFVSGFSACCGFWMIWPFEVLKNITQSGMKDTGSTNFDRAMFVFRTQGIAGFYRGIVPGSQSIFLRNGAAMIVMQHAQKFLSDIGLRD